MTIDAELVGQYLSTIPPWVYPAFFMLVLLGIQATQPIILPVKRLLYMPVIFVTLSFIVIWHFVTLNFLAIFSWSLALILGTVIGWYQLHALRAKAIRDTRSIYVPGTWSLLFAVVFLVILKFYVGYKLSSIDPALLKNPVYAPWFMALYGVLTGMFIGRVGHAFYRVKHGPFIDYDAIKIRKVAPST